MNEIVRQFVFTPAAGKRLIAKSILLLPDIRAALQDNTVVIIAGVTNGYVAEEVLRSLGQLSGFSRERFFRGVTFPPNYPASREKGQFPGDVVIEKGIWLKGKTIFDAVDGLKKGDIIIKGANALNLEKKQAGILIGDPKAGTIGVSLQAAFGRRVALYIPVGLEKRIPGDIDQIAKTLAATNASGPRLLPATGNVITELDAVKTLTGADAIMSAAGGVGGAEGSYWLAVCGTEEQLDKFEEIYGSLKNEENFTI